MATFAPSSADTRTLFEEYARSHDHRARNELVLRHKRLVEYLAGRFSTGSAFSTEDLVQVGYLGLIAAIERYDPRQGVSFVSYAAPTIVGFIKHYLRDQTWGLKAPRRLRDLATRLRRIREEMEQRLERSPTVAELAEAAEVSEERVLHAMEVDVAYQPASLDRYSYLDRDEEEVFDIHACPDPGFAAIERTESLRVALESLDERERAIIRRRFYGEAPQTEVARELGISQMHVSRLERRALQRLRAMLS